MDLYKDLDIYTFQDKTVAERLDEYLNIFYTRSEKIPAKHIQAEWSCDVELVIERTGWLALWKISRYICEKHDIPYPTLVLVEVLKIKYSTLHAEVKIMAVMDNINLPEKYEVPLIELYPTINQKNTSLDIEGTAHCVDRLRFFYNHVWMPWDEDEDENIDWRDHIESRVRLFYYMNSGVIDKETCNVIKLLINEAKEIKHKLPIIMEELSEENKEMSEDCLELESTCNRFRFRLQQIKAEMDFFDVHSVTRKDQLRKNRIYNKKQIKNDNKNSEKIHYFVWLGGTVKELLKLSNKIQEMFSEDTAINVCGCLDEALEIIEENDTILLGEGNHSVKYSSGFEEGGSIIGICNADNTILRSFDIERKISLFDCIGIEVTLKNVCIDLIGVQAGIIVRKNCTVIVTGCRIYVHNNTSNDCIFGAIVMPGGKLVLDNTVFQGLETAVILYSTGEVVMNECSVEKCDNGVRLQDNAHFTANKCSFENIEDAIIMETEKVTHPRLVPAGHKLLTSIKEISLNKCKFSTDDKIIKLRPKGIAGIMDSYNCVMSSSESLITESMEFE